MARSGLGSDSSSWASSTSSHESIAAFVSLASRARARSLSFSSFDMDAQRYRGGRERTSGTCCPDGGYEVCPHPIRHYPPVRHIARHEIGSEPRRDLAAITGQAESRGGVHRGGDHRLGMPQTELRDGE